jgi:putative endonuclease
VIAEVKTRKTNYFGEPESFVTRQKQKNLIKAANEYILLNTLDLDVRFDIVSVVMNSSTVNHIEDAFSPLL